MSADSVSRYRILSKLGHGGRGRVCLAEDRTLGRRVALKFLTAAGGRDGSAHRKLIREAQAAARLDHPFICKVYEVGESGGEPFIAMEYLEGEVLKDRIARGPLPLADALRLGVEIAEALECAQANAVVHRDLKPGNVMLTRDGHAKVMDFGIATVPSLAATPDGTLATTVTATGTVTGTLAYMSPEQLRGQPVDSRSDIFAFGLVLYEMLTGRHPFAGPTPIATAEAILHGPVPPLEVHVEKPPPLLSHIMARLLARDRDGRFQTFRDVRSELLSLAGGGPAAAPASRRAGWRRPRLAASAVVVAIAALAIWQVPNRLDRPALAFSERDWIVIADVDNQTGDPVFDRSLSTALTVGLSQSQYLNVLPPGRVQEALQRMQRPATDPLDQPAAAELAVREGAKAVLACSIAQVGHVYQLTAQLIDPQTRAAVLTESERADRKDDVLPALDSLATRIRRGLGESLGSLSRQQLPMPEATTASLDALRMYADADRAPDRDTRWRLLEQAVAIDPAFAMAHAALGLDYYLQPDRATRLQGEAHLQKALALLDRLSFRERLLITALAEDSRGHREAAATAYQAYLTAYPDDRNVWFRLGWTQMATLRRYEQAVEAFNRVIAIDPFHSAALINLATSLQGPAEGPGGDGGLRARVRPAARRNVRSLRQPRVRIHPCPARPDGSRSRGLPEHAARRFTGEAGEGMAIPGAAPDVSGALQGGRGELPAGGGRQCGQRAHGERVPGSTLSGVNARAARRRRGGGRRPSRARRAHGAAGIGARVAPAPDQALRKDRPSRAGAGASRTHDRQRRPIDRRLEHQPQRAARSSVPRRRPRRDRPR